LSVQGRLGAFVAERRFYEIGSMQGLSDFEEWVAHQPAESLCLA
jgi:hypothetical protein